MNYSFDKATENKRECPKCKVYYPESSKFFNKKSQWWSAPGSMYGGRCKKCKGVATWKLSQERGGLAWKYGKIEQVPVRWNDDLVGHLNVFVGPSESLKMNREKLLFEAYDNFEESEEKELLEKSFPFLLEVSR